MHGSEKCQKPPPTLNITVHLLIWWENAPLCEINVVSVEERIFIPTALNLPANLPIHTPASYQRQVFEIKLFIAELLMNSELSKRKKSMVEWLTEVS